MASVFFSYSHKDEALRDQLESHLALLKMQGLIDGWHDRRIIAGDELDNAIFRKLETADIILLLISNDFISSPYCYSQEMMRAMELHESGKARVIPVILRHCDWKSAPFGKLMAAPRDGKPVTAWADRDEALADVAKQVRKAAEAFSGGSDEIKARLHREKERAGAQQKGRVSTASLTPRSSNLRLRKEFTEKDIDDFLRDGFEFMCRFFKGSIDAISDRNPDVSGSFERIDSRRMAAALYRNGKKIAECSVRLDGFGRQNGIAFAHDASASLGTFNELLSVNFSDQSLYFKSMGMAIHQQADRHLSQEGAAEFFWDLFISPAQR